MSCLSYFSIALKKHHGPDNLLKKVYFGKSRFRGWVHCHHGGEYGPGAVAESYFYTYLPFIRKHWTEGANWKWRGLFKPQSLLPKLHLQQGHTSWTVPPTQDQVFKQEPMRPILIQTTTFPTPCVILKTVSGACLPAHTLRLEWQSGVGLWGCHADLWSIPYFDMWSLDAMDKHLRSQN